MDIHSLHLESLEYFATRSFTLQSEGTRVMMFYPHISPIYLTIPSHGQSRTIYLQNKAWHSYEEQFLSEALKDIPAHFAAYKKAAKYVHFCSRALASKKTLTSYTAWLKSITFLSPFIVLPFAIERTIEPELRQHISSLLYDEIARPSRLSEFERMRLGSLSLAATGNAAIAEELAKKYYWYSEYSYAERLLDKTYFLEEAKKLTQEEISLQKKALLQRKKPSFEKIDIKMRSKAMLAHLYTFLRTDRVDQLKKAQVRIRLFYAWLAKRHNISYDDILLLTNDEIIHLLETGALPRLSVLEQRRSPYVYCYDGSDHFFFNKEVEIITHHLQTPAGQSVQGKVAFPGSVMGKVCIIRSKIDLEKVGPGDILVTHHTIPEYISAMEKSAGIVTDEGGMTSHAAIIARELKKPCVVGTKHATTTFKEGDLVEVDANKGIIRKINL